MLAVMFVCALMPAQAEGQTSKPVNFRFRISWGGGQNQSWQGSVLVDSGTMARTVPLGLNESSATTAIIANDHKIIIAQTDATNYDGFDFAFTGPIDSKIQINLGAKDDPDSQFQETLTIAQLVDGNVNRPLDDLGNRLTITRAPGDDVSVQFQQDHLVVRPGETLPVSISLNHCHLKPSKAKLTVSVVKARESDAPIWSDSQTIHVTQDGNSSAVIDFKIDAPTTEGVYDLIIEANKNWLGINNTTANPALRSLTSPKGSVYRTIQFVVIGDVGPRSHVESEFRVIGEISPKDIQPSVPNWRIGSYPPKNSFLSNQKSSIVQSNQNSLLEMETGAWQAIRLPLLKTGQPHIIEIEYPTDQPIALGMSVLDQSPQGQVAVQGADCGIQIPDSIVVGEGTSSMATHRITFWPKSREPYLLLANQSTYLPARFGNIRILAGPQSLPGSVRDSVRNSVRNSPRKNLNSNAATRKRLAWHRSPSFMDNFGVQKFFDPSVGQPLDDWVAFYQGTTRLIEYLKAHHYQGAMITVTSDGSSIYPTALEHNTPTHDSGVFLSNGQDPFRKDVLRMMLKMFERDNLMLVPAFSFSQPLKQVEALRDTLQTPQSFDLVDQTQRLAAGSDWRPRYNPLDETVQASVVQILDTFLKRYRGFGSLGGLSLICHPSTYTILPSSKWGHDRHTTDRFLQSTHPQAGVLAAPAQQPTDQPTRSSQQPDQRMLEPTEQQWIQWRCDQMTRLYQSIAEMVDQQVPDGQLFIVPLEIHRSDEAFSALCPNLHASVDFEQLMQQHGFDRTELLSDPRIVLLNPQSLPTAETLSASRAEINATESHRVSNFFAGGLQTGTLFQHQGLWAHFAQLQSLPPFDQQSGRLMRRLQLTPAGHWNRQRFISALRQQDSFFLIDGGHGLAQGQESSLANFAATYAQLPRRRFLDVPYKMAAPAANNTSQTGTTTNQVTTLDQSVVVRQTAFQGRRYLYAINDSPYHATVAVDFSNGAEANEKQEHPAGSFTKTDAQPRFGSPLTPVASNPVLRYVPIDGEPENSAPLQSFDLQTKQLTLELPPFAIAAGFLLDDQSSATRYTYQIDSNIVQSLRKKTYALQAKLNLAKDSQPLNVLPNADFESAALPEQVGWSYGDQKEPSITLDRSQGHQSKSSLKLTADGSPVWIRSSHFKAPATGRISVTAYLKIDQGAAQPPLRIAIEGETSSSTYYRFGSVGGLAPRNTSKQLDDQWRQFAVHFDDLPADIRDLRIGFDLMSEGSVWIDNVAVRDRWFDENDAKAMTQLLAGAVPLVDQPSSYESCRRILESYWPRFLDHYIEVGGRGKSVDLLIAEDSVTGPQGNIAESKNENNSSVFKRVKSNSPSLLRRWRSHSLQR
jgi:hypothetical protein